MARATWIGELAFGRVRIPVRLEPIVHEKTVRAHLVHRDDHGRLEQRRFCKKCKREIAWDDTARAVEVGDREVVDFEPGELKGLLAEREAEVALLGFAGPDAVDPVYFDRSYTVVPLGKQPRAYEVLAGAMRDAGRIAVTHIVLSGKSHPAVVRPRGGELVLSTLHFGDEVREAKGRPDPQLRPTKRELDLAEQLIERMGMPFDPTATEDPYRQAVEEIAAGREARPIDEEAARRKQLEADSEVMDLMSALERSLGEKHAGEKRIAKAARTAGKPRAPSPRRHRVRPRRNGSCGSRTSR